MLSVGEGQIILFTYAWGKYRHLRRSSSTTGNLHIWGGNKFVSPSDLVGNVKVTWGRSLVCGCWYRVAGLYHILWCQLSVTMARISAMISLCISVHLMMFHAIEWGSCADISRQGAMAGIVLWCYMDSAGNIIFFVVSRIYAMVRVVCRCTRCDVRHQLGSVGLIISVRLCSPVVYI